MNWSKGENENPFTRAFTLTQTFLTFLDSHKWPRENLFDDLLTNGTHTWQTSCSELASSLRIQNSDMERTPISIDLASVIPLPLPQQQKQIDSSVKLTVKGITPMINSELAASIIVPPIICKPEPPHSRKQARNPPILFGSGGSARVSACNPEQKCECRGCCFSNC